LPIRAPKPDYATSETSNPQAVTLGAGVVTTPSIVPTTAHGQSIVGLQLSIAATVTQSAAADWQVSELFEALKITKGSETKVNPQSFAQLQRLYNALTSLTDASQPDLYFNDPTSAGDAGQTSQTLDLYLPLEFSTETPVILTVDLKGISAVTNCTAGSVTVTVTWLYSPIKVRDDLIKIVSAPTALGTGIDIDVSQYFSDARVINEVWFDVTADANLNYQKFTVGNITVYDKHNPFRLRALTTDAKWMQSYAGFFAANDMPVSYPASGSTASAKPTLTLNLAVSVQPTFYLFIKS
jgi:hypothetical protein